MKFQILLALPLLVALQSASATTQCPPGAENCGPNPFYPLIIAFTQVCAEKYPEQAARLQAQLEMLTAEDPAAYAKLKADPKFLKTLEKMRQQVAQMPPDELRQECLGRRDK
ncbi:hypothetical protein [Pseudoduganella violacea]|uniref:Uncharacterized protein n=1 Tax=Pseudoduganella violacea TaxID=1715466 RepID=A0A7W5BCI9_9BURK|nr:hypothetical protein [Pseudoduganella violacea]MBB3120371.1 hypothetical protein [Pseudoduganella violacea]